MVGVEPADAAVVALEAELESSDGNDDDDDDGNDDDDETTLKVTQFSDGCLRKYSISAS